MQVIMVKHFFYDVLLLVGNHGRKCDFGKSGVIKQAGFSMIQLDVVRTIGCKVVCCIPDNNCPDTIAVASSVYAWGSSPGALFRSVTIWNQHLTLDSLFFEYGF